MKQRHACRFPLPPVNILFSVNKRLPAVYSLFKYQFMHPTRSASAFVTAFDLSFDESEFEESLSIIGSGFFADVFRVRHYANHTLMAWKVPKVTQQLSNFMKEVQILRRLNHENVLRFHGSCIFGGKFGCLTEYLDSGSLGALIETHGPSLTWLTTVGIADDVAKGLSYLHRQSILHRDLSSDNVLLHRTSERGADVVTYRAVIADLGLFLDLRKRHSDRKSLVGNPFYIAPENLSGCSVYDYPSDVFSFGMILCELITGIKNDPDKIPRTRNFGLNYTELRVKADCPRWLHGLACDCCMVCVALRPSMKRACKVIAKNQQYIHLWTDAYPQEDPIQRSLHLSVKSKQRSVSVSVHNDQLPSLTTFEDRDPVESISEGEDPCFTPNGTSPPPPHSPLYRFNSLDSVSDPRLLGLQKASRDPCFVNVPLRICMRNLDPRLRLRLARPLARSESDLSAPSGPSSL